MKKKSNNYYFNLIIFLGWLVYMSAYIGRLNFSASIIAIADGLGAGKAELGLVTSFFFFAYGVGQLVNGLLCYKYNSKLMIFLSLFGSAVLNLVMGFLTSVAAMKYLWGINGFLQSILWSSIVRLQSEFLPQKKRTSAIIAMSTTTALGTFIAYGLAALLTAMGKWRLIFYIAAGVLAVVSVIWFFGLSSAEKNLERLSFSATEKNKEKGGGRINPVFIVALSLILISAAINGLIKDGVVTWVPNLLYETFSLADYFSILLTLLLPLSSFFGAALVQLIYRKIKNYVIIIAMLFLFSTALLTVIYLFYAGSIVLTIAAFSLIACFMSGINNILTSALPLSGVRARAGTFAGVINTFTYAGSTVATVLLGALAESGGWGIVILVLTVICAVAIVIASVGGFLWGKSSEQNKIEVEKIEKAGE